jgi:hypothetical protein
VAGGFFVSVRERGRVRSGGKLQIEDQAEARVLWDVCCLLERQLAGPFMPNYDEPLAKARDTVRDADE